MIQYLNEREIWRIDGRSEIMAAPMSIVVNASAGMFLHAVGAAFRFNGRVVHCGNYSSAASHTSNLPASYQILRVRHRCHLLLASVQPLL